MRRFGFSSGAIAYGDFRSAIQVLSSIHLPCLELSALRVSELRILLSAIPFLDLASYTYISFHAPSNFGADEEERIADLLYSGVPESWPIVIHPDTISNFSIWRKFGKRIAIENMDRRKPVGRTACELLTIFDQLPEASLCLDLGHARQCDASMTEAFLILSSLAKRLVQIHISEVNSASQHDPISHGAILAFQQIAGMIPDNIPVIVESRVAPNQIVGEAVRAAQALMPSWTATINPA
jgi:Xylose isomerase-like TIM barrel